MRTITITITLYDLDELDARARATATLEVVKRYGTEFMGHDLTTTEGATEFCRLSGIEFDRDGYITATDSEI